MKLTSHLLATIACSCSVCFGGDVHDADFVPAVVDGKIVVGAVDPDTNQIVYPSPIKSAIFGTEGFPNFTNDPGFNSELGGLISGMTIGFNILQAPRIWDDVNQDFETIATEQLIVRAAGQNIHAPMTDTVVMGIPFGQASLDPSASFHHHMQYLLNGGLPPMVDGVWMLQLELWSENMSIEPSDPLYIVFGQGDGEQYVEDAIEWIEDNLLATSCAPDLTGDQTLDFFDISAFLTAFSEQDSAGDFNSDGQFDFFDISAFLSAYSAGCP
ncbi:MAG: hypothetical protein JJ974_04820 [Phycisphaerales bacterium]|nr:hypothetical protein [Phycisphaerales bacterium]